MLALGWILVIFGAIGLFLPPFPALLVLAIGLVILGRRSPRVRLSIRRLGKRYPSLGKALLQARARLAARRRRRNMTRAE